MSKLTQLSAFVLLMGAAVPSLDAVLDDQDLLHAGVPQKKLTVRFQHVSGEEQNTKAAEASAVLTPKTSLDEAQERREAENQKLKEITAQLEEHRKKEELLKAIAEAEELLAEKRALAEIEAQKVVALKAANDQKEKEAKRASPPAPQVATIQPTATDLNVKITKLEGKINKQVGRFVGHVRKGKF